LAFSKMAIKALSEKSVAMTGQPMRSAGFVVLKAPDVPSVLIELGYLSSREDEKLMLSAEWRERAGQALSDAIHHYFEAEKASKFAAASP
jgi:N-acetylmuramoyl-L-alanine amidase